MEVKNVVKSLIITTFVLFSLPSVSHAYKPTTTHAALTREILLLHNLTSENIVPQHLIEQAIQGSIDEDFSARPGNHFYDPVYGTGVKGWRSSREWAIYDVQEYSWSKALQHYANGDEEKAYKTLGHLLHLIEDAAVPAHTRDDAHTFNAPYEDYTNRYSLATTHIAESLQNKQIPRFNSFGEYLHALASYTNSNFFSEDTIEYSKYPNPKVIRAEGVYRYGIESLSSQEIILFLQEKSYSNQKTIPPTIDDPAILDPYWNLLSTQAVLTGAGVVALFQQEAEHARQEKQEHDEKETLLVTLLTTVLTPVETALDFTQSNARNALNIPKAMYRESSFHTEQLTGVVEHQVETNIEHFQELVHTLREAPIQAEPSPPNEPPPPPVDLSRIEAQLQEANALVAFLQLQLTLLAERREKECIANSKPGPWNNVGWVGDTPGCDDETPWIQKMFWAPIQGAGGEGTTTGGTTSGEDDDVGCGIIGCVPDFVPDAGPF